MRKNLLLASALGFGLTMSGFATAAETMAPAANPDYTMTYNIGLFSSYQFRGLEQTGGRPALQGGLDWTHSSGFYLGAWASNVSWLEENSTYSKASLEIDGYGGYKNTIGSTGIGYDVGILGYYYGGERAAGAISADTIEMKTGLTYDWLSFNVWTILTKQGLQYADARGSYYLDLSANLPIMDTGLTAILHAGRQNFSGNGGGNDDYSYTDYKIGLSKAWTNGVTVGGYYTDTTTKPGLYTYPLSTQPNFNTVSPNYWGDDKVTVFVQKFF